MPQSKKFLALWDSRMQPTRTILMAQCGQCIFICQPRNEERDTKGSLIDYEFHKIKRTVLYAFVKCYGVHLCTGANNPVSTTASTRLPEQNETIHVIQMLRQEACNGQMHDLAHVLTQSCLAHPLTKKSVSPSLLISTFQTGVLREVDTYPPFSSTVQHKAFVTDVLYPDPKATEDYWTHLMCGSSKIAKTQMCHKSCGKEVNGGCCIYAVALWFEVREGSRLSDYWQQRTKSQLRHVHVTPRETLFTPVHAPRGSCDSCSMQGDSQELPQW